MMKEQFSVKFEDVEEGGHQIFFREPGNSIHLPCTLPITVDDQELIQRIKNICGALETVLNETIKKRRKQQ